MANPRLPSDCPGPSLVLPPLKAAAAMDAANSTVAASQQPAPGILRPVRRSSMPDDRINLYEATFGACRRLPGPCSYTVCRFNLTAELRDKRGAKPSEIHAHVIREACALEAAEHGGMTLAEVALRLSLTRERVRQIEEAALKKMLAGLEHRV